MPGGASGLPSVEISQERSLQRVLIVEDNDDLRNYLIDMFKTDYYTQSCPNGKEALAIIREFNPVLVISDIMMPELGGDKLCSTIKGDLETSHIPVILLTALGDEKICLKDWQSERTLILPNLSVWGYSRQRSKHTYKSCFAPPVL